MADLAKLVEELSALTVMEAADLSKMLEEKWGVSAAVAAVAAPAHSADRSAEDSAGAAPASSASPSVRLPSGSSPASFELPRAAH